MKLQVLLQEAVGADQQVHLSRLGPGQDVPHLAGVRNRDSTSMFTGKRAEAVHPVA